MNNDEQTVLNREELADFYKVSKRTIGVWISQRRIPILKIGRTVRFNKAEVIKALSKFEIKSI